MVQVQVTPNKNLMLPFALDLSVTTSAAVIGQLTLDMTPHWSKQLKLNLCCDSGPVMGPQQWTASCQGGPGRAVQLHSNITCLGLGTLISVANVTLHCPLNMMSVMGGPCSGWFN